MYHLKQYLQPLNLFTSRKVIIWAFFTEMNHNCSRKTAVLILSILHSFDYNQNQFKTDRFLRICLVTVGSG